MADVKLHRCPFTFLPASVDPCGRVQNALDEQGVSYEVRKEWGFPRNRRKEVVALSGQDRLPVIEFGDGSGYREESGDMAATIGAGRLFEKQSPPAAAG